MRNISLLAFVLTSLLATPVDLASAGEVQITPDIVYGHKAGMALTMDRFEPEEANGAAVLFMVSGGWFSRWSPPQQLRPMFQPLLERGFNVFAVRHGSSPQFSIAEAVRDVRRSVRFVRMHAADYGIQPDRIGVFGMSAGGHLSLMLGTTSDAGDPSAADPVARVSDRVNAVVAYVAPTDLRVMATDAPDRLADYEEFPALQIDSATASNDSPLLFVTPDDPPTLLLAGVMDTLVPIFHSRNIQKAFEEAGVTSKLVEYPESGHGLRDDDMRKAAAETADWFAEHLSGSTSAP